MLLYVFNAVLKPKSELARSSTTGGYLCMRVMLIVGGVVKILLFAAGDIEGA